MANSRKFGKITVEKGNIGENTPVFLFRPEDRFLTDVLEYYYDCCALGGSPLEHLAGIRDALSEITVWQQHHPVKVPD